ncbi:TauD/TfdA family dioxygenase [Streptomyces sp. NBC_00237]|uniref:TauD/TfdA family dioxygenase n=1 Tax=Streptomyces sp. NBC_00237 TaxID=2975687 RepID=UPI00225B3E24|nr:TauD/TfdA family dioxygenase [Streptomyces sp. NBC_00237]MCX5202703.1 TauD/TfdA family dioxygenase [Streptomyces sp. NBC_00237]
MTSAPTRSGPAEERSLPLLVTPPQPGADLVSWAAGARRELRADLQRHGALLLRGWEVPSVAVFEEFLRTAIGEPLAYELRSSPRHAVANNVYTSTDHPADEAIFLHNEQSYGHVWPRCIAFHCVTEPATDGATPIADLRAVTRRIDRETAAHFADGYQLVRHFHEGMGLSWQTAFGCESREEAEEICARHDIRCEWLDDGLLRTRQLRPVTAGHPATGDELWFNHLVFFHPTTLAPDVQEALLSAFPADQLPYDTRHADGSPIDPAVVARLRAAYEAESVRFSWRRGDILVLDNMLTSHAREPYTGERRIVVAMAEAVERAGARS